VNGIKVEEMGGAFEAAFDLVDVYELKFRVLTQRSNRESSDSSKTVDADVHAADPR
jgi:hypothetical protein